MKKATSKNPDKPRRRGVRYCSPDCGRGCTITEYRRAVERADALAAKLGKGWKGEVWENMGWHHCAVHSVGLAVYDHGTKRFWITTTSGIHQHQIEGTTPRNAVNALRALLAGTVAKANQILSAV